MSTSRPRSLLGTFEDFGWDNGACLAHIHVISYSPAWLAFMWFLIHQQTNLGLFS